MNNVVKKLKYLTKKFKEEIQVYRLIMKDRETPLAAKILLGATIAYALSPIDIIPDFIPIIGYLDDLIIVPILLALTLRLIPKEVIQKHRKKTINLS